MVAWNISMPDAEWYTSESGHDALQRFVNSVSAHKHIALDTETTGLNYMTDIPLFWSLSWREGDREAPRRACLRADTLPLFKHIFRDPDKEWIFANAKYDTHILYNAGIRISGKLVDTQVMHSLLYEEKPHGLKQMTESLLGWRWKSFEETFGRVPKDQPDWLQRTLLRAEKEDLTALVEYASNDAYGTYEVYRVLKEELENAWSYSLYSPTFKESMRYPLVIDTLWDYFYKLEVPFTKVLWKCERNGAFIDTEYLQRIEGPVTQELAELRRAINREAGRVLNPNSPPQLQEYFFDVKKYTPTKFTKGGKTGIRRPSVDASYLEEIAAFDQVAALILQYRDLSKLLNTYVRGIQGALDKDGRVHTRFNQDVARTGRLSSSEINLQNIPKPESDKFKIRRAFIAEPGNELIVADYEQLEMRLLAAASMEQDMIDIFLRKWDIHMGNAALVFQLPYEDIEQAKDIDRKVKMGELPPEAFTDYHARCLEARQAAKAIGFGLNYGMKETRLAAVLRTTPEEAARLIEQYKARYPAVQRFYDKAIEDTRKTGYSWTLMGRRRFLPDITSNREFDRWRAERQACNVQIQGTAASVVKMAMLLCDDAGLFDEYGCSMLLQVHDELVFECPQETSAEVLPLIRHMMEHSLPTDLSVPLEVSIAKGHNWMDAK